MPFAVALFPSADRKTRGERQPGLMLTLSLTFLPVSWQNRAMDISIPDDQYEKLAERAVAAGYADLSSFFEALAGEPLDDPRGPLSEQALRQSVAELDAADASIDAGKGVDAEQALMQIAEKHDLKIGQ